MDTWQEFDNYKTRQYLSFYIKSAVVTTILLLSLLCTSWADEVVIDIDKIVMIESSGNPFAWNKTDDSRGLYQITPICLEDYNQYHKVQYTMDDLWVVEINTIVADWYMNIRIPSMLGYYGLEDSIDYRLIAYNCGIGCLLSNDPLPFITQQYLVKYQQERR